MSWIYEKACIEDLDNPKYAPFDGVAEWYEVKPAGKNVVLYIDSYHADRDEAARRVNYLNGGNGQTYNYSEGEEEPQRVKNKWYSHADLLDAEEIPDGQLFVLFTENGTFVCRYESCGEHFAAVGQSRYWMMRGVKWWMMIDDLPDGTTGTTREV